MPWSSGTKALLALLASEHHAEDRWEKIAGDMNSLHGSLVAIPGEHFDSVDNFSSEFCQHQFNVLHSDGENEESVIKKMLGERKSSLECYLGQLKETYGKLSNLISTVNELNRTDPFTEQMLSKFASCKIEPQEVKESETTEKKGRGRKRLRDVTPQPNVPVKKEALDQQSPSRPSRSLTSKKQVGSPSPGVVSVRTRSSVNIGSSPSTPSSVVPPVEDERPLRGRSNSRSGNFPPLVIRIPSQSVTTGDQCTSPVATQSPTLAKSPATRQKTSEAQILPGSPMSGVGVQTPLQSTSIQGSRRSPRVAGTGQPQTPSQLAKSVATPSAEIEVPVVKKEREFSPQPRSRVRVDSTATNTDKEETYEQNVKDSAQEDRIAKANRRLLMQMWRAVVAHRHSAIFLSPVTEDIAPNYSQIVYKPKDLTSLKQQIETGKITSVADFQLQLMIMFQNALMYNGREHTVHQWAADMYDDVMQHFEAYQTNLTSDRRESTITAASSGKKGSRSRRRQSELSTSELTKTPVDNPATAATIREGTDQSDSKPPVAESVSNETEVE